MILIQLKYIHILQLFPIPEYIPANSEPKPVRNITFLGYRVSGAKDRVIANFTWRDASTACYPFVRYIVTLSSPKTKEHHREVYDVSGGLSQCV